MNSLRQRVLMIAAGVLASTWLAAWLVGLLIDPGSWPTRYRLLGIGFSLVVASVVLAVYYARQQLTTVQRYYSALSRLDPVKLVSENAFSDLPRLPVDSPWATVASELQNTLRELAERTVVAEQAKASLEIRLLRHASRYAQIEAILDGLSEPVVAIDAYDELLLANPSAKRLLQLETDKPEDRVLANLAHCEGLLELLSDTRRRKTPTQRQSELELVDEAGNKRNFSVTTRSIPGDASTLRDGGKGQRGCGAVAVLRDISNQKVHQQRNAEFVSAVSHEMKTPLAGIKAYLELLVDGDAEDEQTREEFLGVINGQANRLQRLIDNMLNLARIEAGVVDVKKQSLSLNELLEESLSLVRPSAEAKQIELAADLSHLHLSVVADRDMIMQAAINLLSNAIKYTPNAGRVVLRSRLFDGQVCFEVEDTGVGLSENDCQKVFEKFYRVKKDQDMAPGTGLGLPLAKHIVEDVHGGQLQVSSVLGKGSTFTVTLPVIL